MEFKVGQKVRINPTALTAPAARGTEAYHLIKWLGDERVPVERVLDSVTTIHRLQQYPNEHYVSINLNPFIPRITDTWTIEKMYLIPVIDGLSNRIKWPS